MPWIVKKGKKVKPQEVAEKIVCPECKDTIGYFPSEVKAKLEWPMMREYIKCPNCDARIKTKEYRY